MKFRANLRSDLEIVKFVVFTRNLEGLSLSFILLETEGVLYAEKDFNLAEHPEVPGVPNLQVIKLMQSFKSKELVTELFAWRHYYW